MKDNDKTQGVDFRVDSIEAFSEPAYFMHKMTLDEETKNLLERLIEALNKLAESNVPHQPK